MRMPGRLTGCVLVLAALALPQRGLAQGMMPQYGAPAQGMMPQYGPSSDQWVSPNGSYCPPGSEIAASWACPPGHGGGAAGAAHAGYYDRGADYWTEPSPLEATIAHYLRNGFLRVEYMNWDIGGPDSLLGAPLSTVRDPSRPFPVFDESEPPIQTGTAVVPTLETIGLNEQDGVRATWGIPFVAGDLEISAFWLERADAFVRPEDLRQQRQMVTFLPILLVDPGNFAATSFLVNGEPSDFVLLFDRDYEARFSSEIWGTEAIFVAEAWPFSMPVRSEMLSVRPIVGFQYLDLNETLRIRGTFAGTITVEPDPSFIIILGSQFPPGTNLPPTTPPLTSTIRSITDNDLYAGVLGMRAELTHEWFSLGVEPRAALGANLFEAEVSSRNLNTFNEVGPTMRDKSEHFASILQLNTYLKINFTENFSGFVGYDIMYISGITRPDDNIIYNALSPTGPAIVSQDTLIEDLTLQGVTFGGELRFR